MDSFNEKVAKLDSLLAMGHITEPEYKLRKQKMVDEFLNPGAASRPAPFAQRGFVARSGGYNQPMARRQSMVPVSTPYGMMTMHPAMLSQAYGMGAMGGGFGPQRGFANRGLRFDPYKDPASRGPTTSCKVQPIPNGVDPESVKMIFSAVGHVTTVSIKEGVPRHAYVNFTTPEEANSAAALKMVDVMGCPCTVSLSWRAKPAVLEGAPTSGIGIFNMPFTLTQDDIVAMLSQYPGFLNLKMVTNRMGQFRGYCFAYFDSIQNASYAKSCILGMQLGEQTLDCKFSNKSAEEVIAQ